MWRGPLAYGQAGATRIFWGSARSFAGRKRATDHTNEHRGCCERCDGDEDEEGVSGVAVGAARGCRRQLAYELLRVRGVCINGLRVRSSVTARDLTWCDGDASACPQRGPTGGEKRQAPGKRRDRAERERREHRERCVGREQRQRRVVRKRLGRRHLGDHERDVCARNRCRCCGIESRRRDRRGRCSRHRVCRLRCCRDGGGRFRRRRRLRVRRGRSGRRGSFRNGRRQRRSSRRRRGCRRAVGRGGERRSIGRRRRSRG